MYATQQNLEDRFGRQELIDLTDRSDPPTGEPDATRVEKALGDASAEIDGYLKGRYALPLASVPTILERLAADLARYYLYEDRVTEAVKERYNNAVRFLRELADGRVQLSLDAAEAPAAQSAAPLVSSPGRTFTHKTLEDF